MNPRRECQINAPQSLAMLHRIAKCIWTPVPAGVLLSADWPLSARRGVCEVRLRVEEQSAWPHWSTRSTIDRGHRKNRYFYRLLRIASGSIFPERATSSGRKSSRERWKEAGLLLRGHRIGTASMVLSLDSCLYLIPHRVALPVAGAIMPHGIKEVYHARSSCQSLTGSDTNLATRMIVAAGHSRESPDAGIEAVRRARMNTQTSQTENEIEFR
jgi:hypothetical protein